MPEEIVKGLKYSFLVKCIVLIFHGVWFFLSPETYVVFFQWPYLDPIAGRYIGAFMISLAITDILAFRETQFQRVELYVLFLITFLLLGMISLIWGIFIKYTWSVLANFIIMLVLLIAFAYFYFQQKK
jgi:hypothetical protein